MTVTAVPRSHLTGGDLGNVGEISRMSRGLSEMSGQLSHMSAKRRSDVRDGAFVEPPVRIEAPLQLS